MERNPNLGRAERTQDSAPQDPQADKTIFRRLRSVTKRSDGRGEQEHALEADAMLLREENARLRVKLEQPPDVGHVIERLRAISAYPTSEDSDDAWQLLTEAIVMRNALIEVCREIGQAMGALEARLSFLEPPEPNPQLGYLGDEGSNNGHIENGHLEEARTE